MAPTVLLHICCGPCAVGPVTQLREEGHEVRGYFFNPNVHPAREWLARREAVDQVAAKLDLPVIYPRDYPFEEYFRKVAFRESERCRLCYGWRLEASAGIARRSKFDAFTSTLLASHQQSRALLVSLGNAAGERFGIPFLDEDFRAARKRGDALSREWGVYHQDYCGCLFSEAERTLGKRRRAKGEDDER